MKADKEEEKIEEEEGKAGGCHHNCDTKAENILSPRPSHKLFETFNIIIDRPLGQTKILQHTPISVKMSRFVEEKRHEVIIVGAGPVGLFLGLSLARKGVEVLVLEGQKEIIPSPRALM